MAASPEQPAADSAPEWFAFCPRCAAPMRTVQKMDKPRRVCPSCGYVYYTDPKVGVGVAVVEDGKLLLVRRRINPGRGKWSLPAGFVDQGEDPKLTAARETLEETGIKVVIEDVLDVFFNPPDDGGASIFILYRALKVGGTLMAGDDADDAGFFAPDDLPDLAFASTRTAVVYLLKGA
jgi:ADP-ribose pyrophosphatase YjhB (NUDIX family)